MIVINKTYLESFAAAKLLIQDQLTSNLVDIIPIEIKDDLYILSEICLTDDIFSQIFKTFNTYTIRDIEPNEIINIEL
jgi:hypothetical protein